ncbi:hypothetical protein, partial [Streptomyces lavendulocolor]|uniref:hypothetical protein n=1 Tax=Streptomyces lavendulocolor TaxID=67316 RepID=UPI0033E76368
MNLRATVLAAAAGALLTTGAAGAAGAAAAQAAGHAVAPGTGAGDRGDRRAHGKNDPRTPTGRRRNGQ